MAQEENVVVPVTCWDRCAPHYSQPPIYIEHLRTMLAVGTFVSVGDEETRKIFRILVSYKATMVTLNEFAPFAVTNLPSRAPIAEGWGRYLNEVVMMSSLEPFESET